MKQLIKNDEYLIKFIQDLKTPAIAQVSALESLIETSGNKFSQDDIDLIKLTLNSCNYTYHLIDIFSNIVNSKNEKLILCYEKFDICFLLKELIKEYDILLKYNELELSLDSVSSIIINADKMCLRQAIESLILKCINLSYRQSKIFIKILTDKNNFIFKITYNGEAINHNEIKNFNLSDTNLILIKEIINAHFGYMIFNGLTNNMYTIGFCIPEN